MDTNALQQVRRFNRTVTQRIGALSSSYLDSGRPLAEARLLFEIGREGATVRALRGRLGLDSGYLSRLLRVLESDGLVETGRAAGDARVRRVELTARGLTEWERLDGRSQDLAATLLAPLAPSQRQRLLDAMTVVERFMRAAAVEIACVDPAGAEARACLDAYLAELNARFEGGFDPARSVSAAPDELVPPRGWFLLARLDGEPAGCGALKRLDGGVGELKRMWVAPAARGLGVAQRLLDALEAQAVSAGVTVLRLDTNRTLAEAQRLYLRNGYAEIAAYNDNPYADHWFEKRLSRNG
ncbi:MarR family transcriptional regulator [Massilia arenosa]|uniref:MarR family transcriptional regulator n=1 Tax=Zemynaea arenosa TaxID=2561931 RepID=A0A4Y9RZQ3_9BURK|nr:helix-turn-helix domain-containing GNAT family N-acetyltransferase [Massilia arenosa]TFW13215.1 MarR family transcriptional regulator [Massilia arenosa]